MTSRKRIYRTSDGFPYDICRIMLLEERIEAFDKLEQQLSSWEGTEKYETLKRQAQHKNNWFTPEHIDLSITGIRKMITSASLEQWVSKYQLEPIEPKTVGIVMAGNIPLVGFHDLLSVLISGHKVAVKMSSQDELLMGAVIQELLDVSPGMKEFIEIRAQLKEIDAVIATGSDNSSRYFEYYFSKMPNVIRKNRTSVAVITGKETPAELDQLWSDIYLYFGMGCRNVSKLFIPKGFDLTQILQTWENKGDLAHHHKYFNNYEYNKSIYLVNKVPHLDTGYGLWLEDEALVSPISVTYYSTYESEQELATWFTENAEKIQCIVASDTQKYIPFGQAQYPEVWDYADGVDTLAFLERL